MMQYSGLVMLRAKIRAAALFSIFLSVTMVSIRFCQANEFNIWQIMHQTRLSHPKRYRTCSPLTKYNKRNSKHIGTNRCHIQNYSRRQTSFFRRRVLEFTIKRPHADHKNILLQVGVPVYMDNVYRSRPG